jgi:hypothetical protein
MSSENINEGLLLSYIKLLNSSIQSYASLPKWNKLPSIEELKDPNTLKTIYKKIMITLSIFINKTKQNKSDELNHLFVYAHNLLLDEETLKRTTKLNFCQ